MLEVEESAARIRGEIEAMEAEQKHLLQRVSYAAITLQATETWEQAPSGFGMTLHQAWRTGWTNASDAAKGLVLFVAEYILSLLFWMLLLSVPVAFVWRRYRRFHSKL